MTLQITPHRHVELLVGASKLQISANGNRVITLQQRIEKLVEGNRRARSVAPGEIVLGKHLAHRGCRQQSDDLAQIQSLQPLTVTPHFQPPRSLEIKQ